MTELSVPSRWVGQIVDTLSSAGLDMPPLCRQAGLDLRALLAPQARCPTETISVLWDIALAHSGNPALAMAAPRNFKPVVFDAMGYAMMSSANLHAALERGIRYSRIVGDPTTGSLCRLDAGYRLDLVTEVGARPAPRQRYEFTLLLLLTFFRWIAGRPLRPLEVGLAHPAPGDRKPYDEAFQCPLVFDAPGYSILFSHADLAVPLSTANASLVEVHERHADERLEQLGVARTAASARKLIVQALPDGEPTRARIAKALCMSERTFQRRLQDEGLSFHQLLDDTRRALAERYLASDTVSLSEAACLLGFSYQSNFTRASRRWFELSPRKVRSQLTSART